MTQLHTPQEHEAAMAHQREILRCAVIVAMARQAQQLAAQELHDQAEAQARDLFPSDPAAYPLTLNMALDTTAMVHATAELDAAVDQLTDACVAAQIASKAGGN